MLIQVRQSPCSTLLLPLLLWTLLVPGASATSPCSTGLGESELEQVGGANLELSELGELHDLILADVLSSSPPPAAGSLSNIDLLNIFEATVESYFTNNNGYTVSQLAAATGSSEAAATLALRGYVRSFASNLAERFLSSGAFTNEGGALRLRPFNTEALPAVLNGLVADGCLGATLAEELTRFLAEDFETPADFRDRLGEIADSPQWAGLDRVAVDALALVGETSIDYWTDPANPGGGYPTAHGTWGDAAAADAVGGAVGAVVGAIGGALVGVGALIVGGPLGVPVAIGAVKAGAAAGAAVGAAGASVVVKLEPDEGDDSQSGDDSGSESGSDSSSGSSSGGGSGTTSGGGSGS